MSDQVYATTITNAGAAKIAAAITSGRPYSITEAAVGDGGGMYYKPTYAQTELRNEVWRGLILSSEVDPTSANMINVRFALPPEVGGFTVREAGLFDADGDMLAVCNLPDTRKDASTTGSIGKLTIIMHIAMTDTGVLEFDVHPQLDAVTQEQLSSVKTIAQDALAAAQMAGTRRVIAARVRDPSKPDYGVGGGEGMAVVTLEATPYTGAAEITISVGGNDYDVNMRTDGASAPDGTMIIRKVEDM